MRYLACVVILAAATPCLAQTNGTVTPAQHREDARLYQNGKTVMVVPGKDQQQPTPKYGANHQFNPPGKLERDKTTIVRDQK